MRDSEIAGIGQALRDASEVFNELLEAGADEPRLLRELRDYVQAAEIRVNEAITHRDWEAHEAARDLIAPRR